jgi:hypothetical protein
VNKGQSGGKNISATLSATRSTARVSKAETSFGDIAVNEIKTAPGPLAFRVVADSIAIEKFKLTLRDDKKNEWVEYFEIPLKKDVPEIKDFEIADGRILKVTRAGIDAETILLGQGNGDGVANPGESIVILVKDQDKLWRTDLTFSDANLNPFGINVRKSDNWSTMDHVGGSAKYDVPLISSDCPEDHLLEFFVEYWLPEYPYHRIKQGVVTLQVKGKDTTSPAIGRIRVTGDNVLQVNILDGSKVSRVKAVLIDENDLKRSLETSLTDDGQSGDRAENDLVFSQSIPSQVFGIFRVIIEAEDAFGNKSVHEAEEHVVVH